MTTNKVDQQQSAADCSPTLSSDTLANNFRNAHNTGMFNRIEGLNSLSAKSNILATSAPTSMKHDAIRENIERITQLQSKLISALSESNSARMSRTVREEMVTKETIDQATKQDAFQNKDMIGELAESSVSASLPVPFEEPVFNHTTKAAKDEINFLSKLDLAESGLKFIQPSQKSVESNGQGVEMASYEKEHITPTTNSKDCSSSGLQPLHARTKHPIEMECEQMLNTLATSLSPNDSLMSVLASTNSNDVAELIGPLYSFNIPLKDGNDDTSRLLLCNSYTIL